MRAGAHGRARLALQTALAAFFFAGPWLAVGGRRLFGLDVEDGSLRLFGARIPATDLFTAFLALLALLFLLLWITAALGRLWCGWLCPQSFLSDLAARLGGGKKRITALFHGVSALLAILTAFTFLLYFQFPSSVFSPVHLTRPGLVLAAFCLVSVVVYLDMVVVGRRFCLTVCPYGKLLTILTDRDAVEMTIDPDRAGDCIDCGGCERACPMGLKVRNGAGADCIRCARCADACAVALKNRGGGIIGFTKVPGGWLKGVVLRPKHLPLLVLALVAALAFTWRATTQTPVSLAVRATPEVVARLTGDGRLAIFLTTRIMAPPGVYRLTGKDEAGEPLELKGDLAAIEVGTGGASSVRFVLVAGTPSVRATFTLFDAEGRTIGVTEYDTSRAGSEK